MFSIKFNLALSILAKIDKAKAIEFHDFAVSEKQRLFFHSPIALSTYYNSVRLGALSLVGLINSNCTDLNTIDNFIQYIKILPNRNQELSVIAELLETVYRSKDITLFEKLYTKHLQEYVTLILSSNAVFSKSEEVELVKIICPIAYLHNADTGFLLIEKLDVVYQNDCYDEIFNVLIRKGQKSNNEKDREDATVDFETSNSILNLLDKLTDDSSICSIINFFRICARNHSFAKATIFKVSDRVRAIISQKLPDGNNIKHNGYKILCSAFLLKIEKNNKERDWLDLIGQAKGIPNTSDKAYVLIQIAHLLPDIRTISKFQLISETATLIQSIKSYIERVQRYSDIKDFLKRISVTECKEGLKRAIIDSVRENSLELFSIQKSIVDFAYEIDPSYSDELIQIIDEDPARKRIAYKLKQHTKQLKLKNDFIDGKHEKEIKETKAFSKVCIEYIGKLRKHRVRPKDLKEASSWLSHGYKRPLSETFTIFVLFLENANKRFEETGANAKIQLLPYYEATLRNLQMVKVLAGKTEADVKEDSNTLSSDVGSRIIVQIGEKEKAYKYIKEWVTRDGADYIKICDPYFDLDGLQLIKELYFINPDLNFQILMKYSDRESNWIEKYSAKWYSICDQEPPDITIFMVGLKKDDNHFIGATHDRWIITHESGLRLGGSLNTYGKQVSEVSLMSAIEAVDIERNIIDPYLKREKRFHNENRITFFEFNVG